MQWQPSSERTGGDDSSHHGPFHSANRLLIAEQVTCSGASPPLSSHAHCEGQERTQRGKVIFALSTRFPARTGSPFRRWLGIRRRPSHSWPFSQRHQTRLCDPEPRRRGVSPALRVCNTAQRAPDECPEVVFPGGNGAVSAERTPASGGPGFTSASQVWPLLHLHHTFL